jgi:hypothetical protein
MPKNNSKSVTPAKPSTPRWLRPAQVLHYYGLGRSTIYSLMKRGLVKSVSVTKKNTIRGCRLISADSIDHYLCTLQKQQEQEVVK